MFLWCGVSVVRCRRGALVGNRVGLLRFSTLVFHAGAIWGGSVRKRGANWTLPTNLPGVDMSESATPTEQDAAIESVAPTAMDARLSELLGAIEEHAAVVGIVLEKLAQLEREAVVLLGRWRRRRRLAKHQSLVNLKEDAVRYCERAGQHVVYLRQRRLSLEVRAKSLRTELGKIRKDALPKPDPNSASAGMESSTPTAVRQRLADSDVAELLIDCPRVTDEDYDAIDSTFSMLDATATHRQLN